MNLALARFQFYYPYRLLKWKLGDRSPLSAVAKITNRCDLNCIHCRWKELKGEELPTERWLELLDGARAKGCILCIIEGGEPLLRKDIGGIVEHAKGLGMFVAVITNGMHDMSVARPDAYWVSVDGAGESYEAVRGNGNYRKLLENLEKDRDSYRISLTTLSRVNAHSLEQVCKDMSGLVDGMWFNFIYPYKGLEDQALSAEQRIALANRLLELKDCYSIINSETYLRNVGKPWKCWAWATLNISHRGKIHHGCTVEQLEPCRCRECDMSCYAEQSHAYRMHFDSVNFLFASLGKRKRWLSIADIERGGER